ncbi:MAG: hypothetical protein QOJ42_1934, partial [Acidobacteriaceae bacterium]|nr:hypothetical protein [Acidobacteriaceae bacterium]
VSEKLLSPSAGAIHEPIESSQPTLGLKPLILSAQAKQEI